MDTCLTCGCEIVPGVLLCRDGACWCSTQNDVTDWHPLPVREEDR
jgi:hypothetical protein